MYLLAESLVTMAHLGRRHYHPFNHSWQHLTDSLSLSSEVKPAANNLSGTPKFRLFLAYLLLLINTALQPSVIDEIKISMNP